MVQQAVFWSGTDPRAGIIADSFTRAGQLARTPAERVRVGRAANDWWRACGLVHTHGGQLSPEQVAGLAVRAGAVHDVAGLVIGGISGEVGPAAAEVAADAAATPPDAAGPQPHEEGWIEWAENLPGRAYDKMTEPVRTVYHDTKSGLERTYEDVKNEGDDVKNALKKGAENLGDKPSELLWPMVIGSVVVVGLIVYAIKG